MKNKKLIIANRRNILIKDTAIATIKVADNQEYHVAIHTSPNILSDMLSVSCNTMIKMGILCFPTDFREDV